MQTSIHTAVMLEESMLALNVRPGGVYIDGTLGGATHTRALLERSAPNGRVISFDVDPVALARARKALASYGDRWQGIEENFRYLADALKKEGIQQVDGILLDLGLSSDELEDPTKGISFQIDGPLDMRLGTRANDDGLTAEDIVNTWPRGELRQMIGVFGEERFAGRIAEAIVTAREQQRITTTFELVDIIRGAVPSAYENGRIHCATRTFQALRMAVNDEVQALKQAIESAYSVLAPEGRLAIITFHSIEDRIVKLAFQDARWKPLTKKPVAPPEEELTKNPRARSAKLRTASKLL
ncbi:16S rRNA (cytosine(1402)-N(4))-methyltransferase RsmH [Patescibacteria group bacterium]|nr:16S rRNA (cytosine(1402)-N(4))-methyltransferase RsmH [Patescibacteria group bacterium]MBP9709995.1 16S rRNA (cytosine(1402)-N(4))-methyltransferase RsmH [Patescibacteria group bacterium]